MDVKTNDKAFPSRVLARWIAAAVLLAMFALALTSMMGDSPTFDEQGFLVRGLAFLRGEAAGGNRHIRVGHPLGLNALNASLLVHDPTVKLPVDDPAWAGTSFHRPAELFLWEIGNDVGHIMFLARLPTIWVGLLLAAVGARWAAEMVARWASWIGPRGWGADIAGLVTLVIIAFDPNILAHMRLVTTDLGLTAAAALAGYSLWRYLTELSWRKAIVVGVALGLLLNTKFTALLFLPLFGVMALVGSVIAWRKQTRDENHATGHRRLMEFALIPIVAFFTLWAGYGFQTGTLIAPLPVLGNFGGAAVPLSDYLDQLLDIGNRLEVSTPAFLLGRYSDSGWWFYFLVAFLVKTPLPTLILLAWSVVYAVRLAVIRRRERPELLFDLTALLVPAIGFFAIALTTDINLGYRHIMPVLPFLYVLVGVAAGFALASWPSGRAAPAVRSITATLLIWLIAVSVWIYPHYLAFFNGLAGGPAGGWRVLVDSNLDWGQDLGRLAAWLDENGIERVWLSYFGEARPDYYGIRYDGLDSFPPRLMNPEARPFYPPDPAPGWYAISATNLQGVHFADHDQFAIFRGRAPVTRIGYSIFVYEQPARGQPVDLLLAGMQVDDILPTDFALLDTNDVNLRWFDPEQALLLPGGGLPIWLAIGSREIHPLLKPYLTFTSATAAAEKTYSLAETVANPPASVEPAIDLQLDDGRIAIVGADLIQRDDGIIVRTSWRQNASPRPVKIFVHVLDADDNIVAQWDGLGAAWEGWREGDTLVQIHDISINDMPSETYRVVIGLYDPGDFRRWATESGDSVIELGEVALP